MIPEWFVDQTAHATHNVQGVEMRFKINAQSFSHAWEDPRGSGSGRQRDSGRRAFQTRFGRTADFICAEPRPGRDAANWLSGDWQYEEYLRRACQAVVQK